MKKYFSLILTAISLLIISCNPDGPGIFYKISVEPPLSNSSLSEKSIYKVVNDGTKTYVLAGGAVYKESGSDWDKISAPSGENQAVSLEELSGTLYCVYADDNNSTLYSGDGTSWTIEALFTNISGSLTLVASSNTVFVIERISSTQYKIHNLAKTAQIDVTNFVRGAAYDGATFDYLLASPEINKFSAPQIVSYDSTGPTFAAISVTGGDLTTAITDQTALGDIYATGATIYITTKNGFVMKGTAVADGIDNVNSTALDNLKLGAMDIVDVSGTDYLLIGSNGGFYEMELPGGTPVTPTSATIGSTEYLSVDLNTELVFSIMEDGPNGFYIGTNNGLWYSDTNKLDLK